MCKVFIIFKWVNKYFLKFSEVEILCDKYLCNTNKSSWGSWDHKVGEVLI